MTDTTPAPETPAAPAPVASPPVASPASAPAPAAQSGQTAESSPPSPEAPVETDKQPEQEAKRRSASERIAQVTAQKHAAIAERDFARQEAARLRAQLEDMARRPLDQLSYEEQEAAKLQRVVKFDRYEQTAANVENAEARALHAQAQVFNAKVDAVRDRMPDFDEVFTDDLPIGPVMSELIADSEKGAEIAYYLGKNRNEAAAINRLPPHLQGAAIARIEAKVSMAKPRIVSNAPAPVPTIGGGSSPSGKDPAHMTMSEYAAWRSGGAKRA